jgi:hypothetical protein
MEVQRKNSKNPQRICVEYPSIVSTRVGDIRRVLERGTGPKVTYASVPVVPEFVEPLVKTNGESEGAGEDASHEYACRGQREFSII